MLQSIEVPSLSPPPPQPASTRTHATQRPRVRAAMARSELPGSGDRIDLEGSVRDVYFFEFGTQAKIFTQLEFAATAEQQVFVAGRFRNALAACRQGGSRVVEGIAQLYVRIHDTVRERQLGECGDEEAVAGDFGMDRTQVIRLGAAV